MPPEAPPTTNPSPQVPPDVIDAVLAAYARGYFPMAKSRDEAGFRWYESEPRAILDFEDMHISRSLRKLMRKDPFDIRADTDFPAIISACAGDDVPARQDTWINDDIIALFVALHEAGYAHSIGVYQDGDLVGGIYGLHVGGAVFAAESMFSRVSNASKAALVHFCARLRAGGFSWLDIQIPNAHTDQFNPRKIDGKFYDDVRKKALLQKATFYPDGEPESWVRTFLDSCS